MKIKSITDVITNSSTEVFIYWYSDSAKLLMDFVQSILDLTDQPIKATDLFKFELIPSDSLQDEFYDRWDKGKIDTKKYSHDSEGCVQWALDEDPVLKNWEGNEYPQFEGVRLSPVVDTPQIKQVIKCFSAFIHNFKADAWFNG